MSVWFTLCFVPSLAQMMIRQAHLPSNRQSDRKTVNKTTDDDEDFSSLVSPSFAPALCRLVWISLLILKVQIDASSSLSNEEASSSSSDLKHSSSTSNVVPLYLSPLYRAALDLLSTVLRVIPLSPENVKVCHFCQNSMLKVS